MGVINTSNWLKKDYKDPEKLLMNKGISRKKAEDLYEYLKTFGMYIPSYKTEQQINSLQKREAWRKISVYFKRYRSLWKGPDVPIYIFPVQSSNGIFTGPISKSGVSFKNEIYIFLSDEEDPKEWESLFIHEYHHCTRMNRLEKDPEEYNLLDSIIFEGLAEDAVNQYCGEEYVSRWAKKYSKFLLQKLWNQHIKNELHLRRTETKHDQLLLGKGKYPNLIGYSIGYYIVRKFRESHGLSTIEMLELESASFIKNEKVIEG
jgi:uncharacterized protein YjaZ